MIRLLDYLNKQSPAFFLIAGCFLVLFVGVPDYLLKQSISFSIFYLIPVSLSSWFAGKWAGFFIACVSAAAWYIADLLSGNPIAHSYIAVWNAVVRLGFFSIVLFLLTAFKREKSFAREDYLTGLGNRRHFFELADREVKRAGRYGHTFSLAYIDIDHFKAINDNYGHDEGDTLLKSTAYAIKRNVRSTDIAARMGGDEFAVLLPESNRESAVRFFNKLHKILSGVVQERSWPVTFSIGVVTFETAVESSDRMIKIADRVLYAAKESGKNRVTFEIY